MTPPPGNMSKLFGALGADESTFDARVKAAANDAKLRWPMFKSIAPQSSEATPLLTDMEKDRWFNVAPALVDERPPVLSRPGLSVKLFKGLSKIARQTSAEVLGSARRTGPRLNEPEPSTWPGSAQPSAPVAAAFTAASEPAPPVFVAQTPAPSTGLFAKPVVPAPAFAFASAAPVPAPRASTQFQPQHHQQPSAAARPVDDSLSGVFQRLEGNKPKPMFFGSQPVAKDGGVMSRLGKR